MANYVLATTNMSARINQKPFFRPPVDPVWPRHRCPVSQCSCAQFGAHRHRQRQRQLHLLCLRCGNKPRQPTPAKLQRGLGGWVGGGLTHLCVSFDAPSDANSWCRPWSNLQRVSVCGISKRCEEGRINRAGSATDKEFLDKPACWPTLGQWALPGPLIKFW